MQPGRAFVPQGMKDEQVKNGGEGSGNFGHSGRPGEVGGSGPGGASIKIKPYNTRPGAPSHGGNYTIHDENGKEIGHASAVFEHKDQNYPFSGFVPAGTGVIDSIELYSNKQRGKGLGTYFLKNIESDAKKSGIVRMRATSVMPDSERFWEKMGYAPTGKGRIWEKKL